MREGDGGGIVGVPQGDTVWVGGRRAVELGSLGHGRQTTDISNGLPDQGKAAELPTRGIPRMGRDEDGDVDATLQPACTGYCDYLGGGKPPPPKVPTMRHAGSMDGVKR